MCKVKMCSNEADEPLVLRKRQICSCCTSVSPARHFVMLLLLLLRLTELVTWL